MAKKQRKIVLDTNIIFELLKENEKHLNQVDVIDFQSLYVTSITVLETYYGMRVREERKTKELFNSIRKISPDKEVFKKAEELMFAHRGKDLNCLIVLLQPFVF